MIFKYTDTIIDAAIGEQTTAYHYKIHFAALRRLGYLAQEQMICFIRVNQQGKLLPAAFSFGYYLIVISTVIHCYSMLFSVNQHVSVNGALLRRGAFILILSAPVPSL